MSKYIKDIIYRQDAIELAMQYCPDDDGTCSKAYEDIRNLLDELEDLPSAVVEAEPIEFEWCHDCKEYDQNAHCCHRWTKVILNTVNDLKTQGYEPVRYGRWLKNGDRYCECSECHHEGNISGADNYCWYCGAKMDEVTEGAETN